MQIVSCMFSFCLYGCDSDLLTASTDHAPCSRTLEHPRTCSEVIHPEQVSLERMSSFSISLEHRYLNARFSLEYTAPETLRPDPITGVFRQANSKADMWSLGMILHKLIFFKLPYRATEDWESLQTEVLEYSGWGLFLTFYFCSARVVMIYWLGLA